MHIKFVRASISIQFDAVDSIEIPMFRPNLSRDGEYAINFNNSSHSFL